MLNMTVGEIAFKQTRKWWNEETVPYRRRTLRLLAENEVMAESPFDHLPAATRDALITWREKI